jgi:UDP-N-acetylmuramoyl-tripeptide--D-alanyl-D-alanine ligase
VLGVDLGGAADALAGAELSAMRMQIVRAPAGGLVINDAYNANPTSMAAALDALAAVDAQRRVAVLGAMAELDDPEPAHRAIGARAAELGLELIAVGTDHYGVDPVDASEVPARVGELGRGVAVLVKASRAFGLERVVLELAGA